VSIGRRKRNLSRWFNLFLPILALTACKPDAPASQHGQRSVVDVILTVRNESRQAAHVSLASGTARVVLGDLASGASQSFSIPSALVGSPSMLRLEAVGDGGTPARSEDFQVRRGQKVVWSFAGAGRGTLDTK
jgi:hypothetical protein